MKWAQLFYCRMCAFASRRHGGDLARRANSAALQDLKRSFAQIFDHLKLSPSLLRQQNFGHSETKSFFLLRGFSVCEPPGQSSTKDVRPAPLKEWLEFWTSLFLGCGFALMSGLGCTVHACSVHVHAMPSGTIAGRALFAGTWATALANEAFIKLQLACERSLRENILYDSSSGFLACLFSTKVCEWQP